VSEPHAQRLTIVTPTTAQFQSEIFRIGGSAVARGHRVNVIARWAPGLAIEERHPAGYRIIRIPVDPREGLPMPGVLRQRIRRSSAGSTRRPRRGPARLLEIRGSSMEANRIAPPADLVLGFHYLGIGTALGLGRRDRVPVVYDAGDIYLASTALIRLPWFVRSAIRRYERSAARRAGGIITANEAYAEELAQRLDVALPVAVLNCPPRTAPAAVRPRLFHAALGLAPGTRVVLYHGGFTPERGIEQLIEAIRSVDRAVLVLLGFGPLAARYEAIAADPASAGRIRVMPAVDPAVLLDWVASADVAAMPIQPTTLNHRLTTPNKLFEAIAVGVPVVASDLPGMAPIVRSVDAGRLVDATDPVSIARALSRVLDAPEEVQLARRKRILAAAHDLYNWETQSAGLFGEFERLTGQPW